MARPPLFQQMVVLEESMMLERFEQYLSAVPILGFNSQRYDLNVLKPTLMQALHETESGGACFVVKKISSLACMET